jgi:hypothetical protein
MDSLTLQALALPTIQAGELSVCLSRPGQTQLNAFQQWTTMASLKTKIFTSRMSCGSAGFNRVMGIH